MDVADRHQTVRTAALIGSHYPLPTQEPRAPGTVQGGARTWARTGVALAVCLAAACGRGSQSAVGTTAAHAASAAPASSSTAAPDDAVSVARAFVAMLLTRSYLDPAPDAFLDRAAPYMTVRLATRLRQQAANGAVRAEWDALRSARGMRTVRFGPATVMPSLTPGGVGVSLTVHLVTTTGDGTRQTTDEQVALILHRVDDRWLVDHTNLEDQ